MILNEFIVTLSRLSAPLMGPLLNCHRRRCPAAGRTGCGGGSRRSCGSGGLSVHSGRTAGGRKFEENKKYVKIFSECINFYNEEIFLYIQSFYRNLMKGESIESYQRFDI